MSFYGSLIKENKLSDVELLNNFITEAAQFNLIINKEEFNINLLDEAFDAKTIGNKIITGFDKIIEKIKELIEKLKKIVNKILDIIKNKAIDTIFNKAKELKEKIKSEISKTKSKNEASGEVILSNVLKLDTFMIFYDRIFEKIFKVYKNDSKKISDMIDNTDSINNENLHQYNDKFIFGFNDPNLDKARINKIREDNDSSIIFNSNQVTDIHNIDELLDILDKEYTDKKYIIDILNEMKEGCDKLIESLKSNISIYERKKNELKLKIMDKDINEDNQKAIVTYSKSIRLFNSKIIQENEIIKSYLELSNFNTIIINEITRELSRLYSYYNNNKDNI